MVTTQKIVITGMGAVTPVGIGVNKYFKALINGECGICHISAFDADELAVKIAGEVKDFDAASYMSPTLIRQTDSFMQYAYAAAYEAITSSRLEIEPLRTGIVMGTALNGITTIARTQQNLSEAVHKKVGPRFIPKILGNVSAANIAINYNIKGPSITLNTACASGGDAIYIASMLIKSGKADTVIAVGAESVLCPLVIYSLSNAKALSKNPNPESASRPFDKLRDGFVIGEGGGAMVLETEAHEKKRGARILAELAGCANTNDAYHVTAPEKSGESAAQCMELAISDANLCPNDIDYINAHGTGTPQGDICETLAIKSVFKDKIPSVSSTKGATGHMMGAGGITEVIACVKAIEHGIIPPTLNLENPDDYCNLDYTPLSAKKQEINIAMSNAFGFGGQNSSIITKRYKGD